jgi:hypothetical protein
MSRPAAASGGWSRRSLLRGLGALPLTAALRPGRAAASAPPTRFVVLHTGQGCVLPLTVPTGSAEAFTLPFCLEPLAAHQDRLVVISGLDNRVAAHNHVGTAHDAANLSLFSAQPYPRQDSAHLTAGGASIEQWIAERIAGDAASLRVDLAVGGGGGGGLYTSDRFFAAAYDPIVSFNDPLLAIARIFGDGSASPAELAALMERRTSVLDAVSGQLDQMFARVDAAGRATLEAHAGRLEALAARASAAPRDCSRPSPSFAAGYDYTRDDDQSAGVMIDVLVAALACDQARVGTLELTNTHAPTFPWLWEENGGPIVDPTEFDSWHSMVHSDFVPGMELPFRWMMQVLAQLLDRLAATPSPEGPPLLDSTLVLWMPEFSSGRHWNHHLPAVLAGATGLRGGRWLDFLPLPAEELHAHGLGDTVESGATTQQLFTSLLQRFGGSEAHFGLDAPGLPTGPLPGL